jgi:hypothetical protein
MTVGELIELLQDKDPNAKVFVMMQENWPFECGVHGVVDRLEMGEFDDEDDAPLSDGNGQKAPTDVFIVEGRQVRYGNRAAWG